MELKEMLNTFYAVKGDGFEYYYYDGEEDGSYDPDNEEIVISLGTEGFELPSEWYEEVISDNDGDLPYIFVKILRRVFGDLYDEEPEPEAAVEVFLTRDSDGWDCIDWKESGYAGHYPARGTDFDQSVLDAIYFSFYDKE